MEDELKLGLLLKFIHNAIERDCNAMLRALNLTTTQLDMLMFLIKNRHKDVNQKDIEQAFKVKNPTVTGILKRLERKGMIAREADSRDGRIKRIIVTEKSLEMERIILKKGREIDERIAQGLSQNEQEDLRKMLKRVLDNLL